MFSHIQKSKANCSYMCLGSQVMVDNPDFTPSQVGCLFTFLARQLAKPDNTLFVNRKLFDQVVSLKLKEIMAVLLPQSIIKQFVSYMIKYTHCCIDRHVGYTERSWSLD